MPRLILSFLLVFALGASADPVLFRHWTSADGLPDDCVRALTPSADGRLWLRTPGGVCLFDGASFRAFTLDVRRVYRWASNQGNVYRDYMDADGLLWLKSPGYLAVFDTRRECYVDDVAALLSGKGVRGLVDDLFLDGAGNVLYVVRGGPLRYYDAASRRLFTLAGSRGARPLEMAAAGGVVHILCADGRMLRWNVSSRGFVAPDLTLAGRVSPFSARQRMCVAADGALWLGIPSAVLRRDPATAAWHTLWQAGSADGVLTDLVLAADGTAWVSSSVSGLLRIAPHAQQAEAATVSLPGGGVVADPIQCLLATPDGGLWTGHLTAGLCHTHPRMFPFRLACAGLGAVRAMLEEPDGTWLVATSTASVVRLNPRTGATTPALPWLPAGEAVLCLYRDTRQRLWVGTFEHGFYVWDGTSARHYDAMFPAQSRTDHIARAVCDDGRGHIFVSVGYAGAGLLDEHTGRVTQLAAHCRQIRPQRRDIGLRMVEKNVLAVYGEQGLYRYDIARRIATLARNDDEADAQHYGNYTAVAHLLRDTRHLLWTATDNGLRIWDPARRRPYLLTTADGLHANRVCALAEDRDGRVWATTDAGLNSIAVQAGDDGTWHFTVRAYARQSGLWGGRTTEGAIACGADGTVLAGAEGGIYVFRPAEVTAPAAPGSRTLLTGIDVGDRRVLPGETLHGHVALQEPLCRAKEVRLSHDENFITLRFARPDFVSGAHHRYRYRLRGVDEAWVERDFDGEGFATYTALAPGTYLFEVSAADAAPDVVEAAVSVRITPPWYAAWPALVLYAALAAALAWWVWRALQHRRQARRIIAEMRQRERQREEMNEMKFRFFTNVSHEFRTPLTLIMTPLSRLLAESAEPLRGQLQRIYDNADHLLQLINRLLDFRRVEMGGETLRPARCEVVRLVRLVAGQFADVCRSKGLAMTVEAPCGDDLVVWLDQNKLRHVVSNLYSNAIKFTPAGGSVATTISVADGQLHIAVSDTGRGMAAGEAAHVFDRFYQSTDADGAAGSGIGLHIAKRYVELHHGTITAESAGEGKGSVFHIALPMDLAGGDPALDGGLKPQGTPSAEAAAAETKSTETHAKRVLVVEDNAELRTFLAESLAAKYDVVQAANGEEGLAQAAATQPDIIVSDLMMPVVDGLAMCQRIKDDINTSHIPVVILTARASDEARIAGYKVGADSYIAKPFNYDVLEARLAALLDKAEQQRRRLAGAVARGAHIEPSEVTVTPVDEEYLRKALAAVEQHIADVDFGVTELGDALGMSRSQLYRKFENLAGIKPADFIRQVRLRRAAQLLRGTQLNVSEIAYRTGFNFLRYFNQHFKEMYGMTPTAYRTEQRGETAKE